MTEQISHGEEINWSKRSINAKTGDPEGEFGLVYWRSGKEGIRLDEDHIQIPFVEDEDPDNTSLQYGAPERKTIRVFTRNGVLIPIEDGATINAIGKLSAELLTEQAKYTAADRINGAISELDREAQNINIVGEDKEFADAMGVIRRKLLQAQSVDVPRQIVGLADRLIELGVGSVQRGIGQTTFPLEGMREHFAPKD